MTLDDILGGMRNMPRYGWAFAGGLLTALSFLFVDQFSDPYGRYLIASLIVYTLGSACIATVHRLIGITATQRWLLKRLDDTDKRVSIEAKDAEIAIPPWAQCILYGTQLLWFGLFVAYNIWRCVL